MSTQSKLPDLRHLPPSEIDLELAVAFVRDLEFLAGVDGLDPSDGDFLNILFHVGVLVDGIDLQRP